MSSSYRPSRKAAARSAMARPLTAEQTAQEHILLDDLRTVVERSLLNIDQGCHLATILRQAIPEIRRHSLAALLSSETPEPTEQPQSHPVSGTSRDSDRVNPSQMSGSVSFTHRDKPLPSVEAEFHQPPNNNDSADILTADDGPEEAQSAMILTFDQEKAKVEEHQATARPAKKRPIDNEDQPLPVAKRVKTWLSHPISSDTE